MIAIVTLLVLSLGAMSSVTVAQDDVVDESDNGVEPGERLSGVISVTDAEIEGDVATRSFGISIAHAASNGSKAEIVAERLDHIDDRLTELEERKQKLDAAYQAGNITEGQYEAGVAAIAAEQATVKRLSAHSEAVANELPTDVLDKHGVSIERITDLRLQAAELGGEEVAAIAQGIAGDTIGEQLTDGLFDEAEQESVEEDESPENDHD